MHAEHRQPAGRGADTGQISVGYTAIREKSQKATDYYIWDTATGAGVFRASIAHLSGAKPGFGTAMTGTNMGRDYTDLKARTRLWILAVEDDDLARGRGQRAFPKSRPSDASLLAWRRSEPGLKGQARSNLNGACVRQNVAESS